MTITRASMISIPVSDQDRAASFYRDALGFVVENDEAMGPTMRWLSLSVPGAPFSITLVTWFESMPAGSLRGLIFDVESIEATTASLVADGVMSDIDIHEEPWGRYIEVSDPDGNGLILREPPL